MRDIDYHETFLNITNYNEDIEQVNIVLTKKVNIDGFSIEKIVGEFAIKSGDQLEALKYYAFEENLEIKVRKYKHAAELGFTREDYYSSGPDGVEIQHLELFGYLEPIKWVK